MIQLAQTILELTGSRSPLVHEPLPIDDPVRSSDNHFVKASELRWMSLMLLAPIPWAERV